MKLHSLVTSLLLALFAAEAFAQQDVIYQRGGASYTGRVVEVDDEFVSVSVEGGRGTISIPINRIDRVDFAPIPNAEAILQTSDTTRLGSVRALWNQTRERMAIPRSIAGQVGLLYGRLLLERGLDGDAETALEVFGQVEQHAWQYDNQQAARRGRLQALIALGRAEDAVVEARKLVDEADDPELLIEANYVVASSMLGQLRELLEENPRWEEDDRVRPERHRLYREALNLFLFPSLYYGSWDHAAARGLWGAIELYLLCDEPLRAARRAYDLAALYPQGEFAERARKVLEENEYPREALVPEDSIAGEGLPDADAIDSEDDSEARETDSS